MEEDILKTLPMPTSLLLALTIWILPLRTLAQSRLGLFIKVPILEDYDLLLLPSNLGSPPKVHLNLLASSS